MSVILIGKSKIYFKQWSSMSHTENLWSSIYLSWALESSFIPSADDWWVFKNIYYLNFDKTIYYVHIFNISADCSVFPKSLLPIFHHILYYNCVDYFQGQSFTGVLQKSCTNYFAKLTQKRLCRRFSILKRCRSFLMKSLHYQMKSLMVRKKILFLETYTLTGCLKKK